MWFEELTGFSERSPEYVRENIDIIDNLLISKINKKEYIFGKLETPTLEELKSHSDSIEKYHSKIKVAEVVGDIQEIHQEESNNNSLIQVASQFNLLEMANPHRTPEDGVGIYEFDATQGPACAIACGAGTIYRNYFVNINGQVGQTSTNQIDCLKEMGNELENDKFHHWQMLNGYAFATRLGLERISKQIKTKSVKEYEYLKGKLRIGIQWDSEVTINRNRNMITQVYCSALPVAYSNIEKELWSDFARLILEGTYEATFFTALKNYEKTGNNKVFLTLVGGGAFGNDDEWIFNAIAVSIKKFINTPLDIKIVSYGDSNWKVKQFIDSIKY